MALIYSLHCYYVYYTVHNCLPIVKCQATVHGALQQYLNFTRSSWPLKCKRKSIPSKIYNVCKTGYTIRLFGSIQRRIRQTRAIIAIINSLYRYRGLTKCVYLHSLCARIATRQIALVCHKYEASLPSNECWVFVKRSHAISPFTFYPLLARKFLTDCKPYVEGTKLKLWWQMCQVELLSSVVCGSAERWQRGRVHRHVD